MSRKVIENADPCPFCGCRKIFLKACLEGYYEKRIAASLQCSSCHVNGPQVFSDYMRDHPSFPDTPKAIQDDLIARATEKWNTRKG